jgi:hypothetical protein
MKKIEDENWSGINIIGRREGISWKDIDVEVIK